jgi:hypothetical protein
VDGISNQKKEIMWIQQKTQGEIGFWRGGGGAKHIRLQEECPAQGTKNHVLGEEGAIKAQSV